MCLQSLLHLQSMLKAVAKLQRHYSHGEMSVVMEIRQHHKKSHLRTGKFGTKSSLSQIAEKQNGWWIKKWHSSSFCVIRVPTDGHRQLQWSACPQKALLWFQSVENSVMCFCTGHGAVQGVRCMWKATRVDHLPQQQRATGDTCGHQP